MNLLTIALLAFAVASPIAAGADQAEYQSVIGSKHDLSINPDIAGDVDACAFCHAVNPDTGKASADLNRNPPRASFTLYDSPTLSDKTPELGEASLHCLSCHDGVTPFDALGDFTGTENNNMTTVYPDSPANIGRDLSNHHPVGVMILGNKDIKNQRAITGAGLEIYDDRLECPSCHEVHGKNETEFFLRIGNVGASLCQACHNR